MKVTLAALLVNLAILVVLILFLSSQDESRGILIPGIKAETVYHVAGVATFYVLQISSSLAQGALEETTEVLFGYLFCQNGINLSAVGYVSFNSFQILSSVDLREECLLQQTST
jgi:hypothetical protein